MACVSIKTRLQEVYVVGEFCNWNPDNALHGTRTAKQKLIIINDMPRGEYRVLCCKSYHGGEIYPTDGRQMPNRFFGGTENETIHCYF